MSFYNNLFYNIYILFGKKDSNSIGNTIIVLSFTHFTHLVSLNLIYGIVFKVGDFHLSLLNIIFAIVIGLLITFYFTKGKRYEKIIEHYDSLNSKSKIKGKLFSILYIVISIILSIIIARIRYKIMN